MREILFRGFHETKAYSSEQININGIVIEGVWFEGDLITGKRESILNYKYGVFAVIPETIGQFTGLTDKNGTKIFEGDIVKFECGLDGDGEISTELIEIYYDKTIASFLGHSNQQKELPVTLDNLDACEVVGNIYDNPELMAVENG